MPAPFGLLPTGFSAKSAADIKLELDNGLKATVLGQSAGTEPDGSIPLRSVAGQFVSVLTDALSGAWDDLQAIYAAHDPNGATGVSLDHLCAITGTIRDGEARSFVDCVCTGTPATPLPAGRVATVTGTGTRFLSGADVTIAAAIAWVGATPYVVGDRRTNAARIYHCITAGNSAGVGGPTTTAADILDGTVHWRYVGDGTGYVDVQFLAEEVGPFGALSGELVTIATPVSGWLGVRNLVDAEEGSFLEVDSSLRLKREEELSSGGNASPNAIRANVLKVGDGTVDPVRVVRVFYNDTMVVNADGLPPKSVEVLVLGGDDQEIAEAVFESVAAGIETFGNQGPFTVTDSAGNPQLVEFSRPTEKLIWIIADVTYDATKFPTDLVAGAALIEGALVTYGDTYAIGLDVRANALEAAIFRGLTSTDPGAAAVPGILDVTKLWIGLVNPPVAPTTIVIGIRELARFDTARITINLAAGTP